MATVELRNAYGIALEADDEVGLTRFVTVFLSLVSVTLGVDALPNVI